MDGLSGKQFRETARAGFVLQHPRYCFPRAEKSAVLRGGHQSCVQEVKDRYMIRFSGDRENIQMTL